MKNVFVSLSIRAAFVESGTEKNVSEIQYRAAHCSHDPEPGESASAVEVPKKTEDTACAPHQITRSAMALVRRGNKKSIMAKRLVTASILPPHVTLMTSHFK